MIYSHARVAMLMLCCAAATGVQGQVYKSIDADGNVTYSASPPADPAVSRVESVRIDPGPPEREQQAAQQRRQSIESSLAQRRRAAAQTQQESADTAAAPPREPDEPSARETARSSSARPAGERTLGARAQSRSNP
jgi:hypothetical protein